MPWFKVDDGLHSHPKALEAGLEAMGLWVLLGSHCGFYVGQRGRVSRASAIRIAGSARTLQRCAARLVKAGFWEPDGEGWVFHDWDVYQPTPEAIEAEQLRKSIAGKAGAAARAAAKVAAEHDPSTVPTRNEHDASTTRARDEHNSSTISTRREHTDDSETARPDDLTSRNNSAPLQQLLTSCSSDVSGTAVARPVPSRPVPVNGCDPAGAGEAHHEPPPWFLSAVGTVEMGTGIEIDRPSAWLRYEGHRAQKGKAMSEADARYWLTTVLVREASQDRERRREQGAAPPRVEPPIAPAPVQPTEPEREYTPEEIAAIDAQIAERIERLNNAHAAPARSSRRVAVAPSSGDVCAMSPEELDAERKRQHAKLAAILADEESSRVA